MRERDFHSDGQRRRLSHSWGRGAALFFLVAFFSLLWTGSALALTVRDVRIGQHPDKTRIVFDLSEKTEFRTFVLTDPWRLVVDMPVFGWEAGMTPVSAGSGVRLLRQGPLQPGYSRIVIDLDRQAAIRSVFVLPRDGAKPERLVIDIKPGERDEGKVFGLLKPEGAGLAQAAVDIPPPRPAPPVLPVTAPRPVPAEPARISAAPPDAGVLPVPPQKPGIAGPGEKPLIVIDPGHGGIDPGAPGANGLHEKHVTLAVAKELKKQLEETGRYRVVLTRENDSYLRLFQRVEFARRHGGDLFISLHADSIGKGNVRGASVYTLSDKASDEQTEKLAMRENRADLIAGVDLAAEDAMVANILVDLTMRDTMNQSRFMANTAVDALKSRGVRILENPHRYAGFAVLKAPDVPSILVEMGFMSNANEAQLLSTNSFQRLLASGLVRSIDAYFSRAAKNGAT